MSFTHKKHYIQNDKLKIISHSPVYTNGKANNHIIIREPINHLFYGMLNRVKDRNVNCESCHKR